MLSGIFNGIRPLVPFSEIERIFGLNEQPYLPAPRLSPILTYSARFNINARPARYHVLESVPGEKIIPEGELIVGQNGIAVRLPEDESMAFPSSPLIFHGKYQTFFRNRTMFGIAIQQRLTRHKLDHPVVFAMTGEICPDGRFAVNRLELPVFENTRVMKGLVTVKPDDYSVAQGLSFAALCVEQVIARRPLHLYQNYLVARQTERLSQPVSLDRVPTTP